MRRDRRNFSAAFKAKVAVEALREQKSMAQLATEYELHPNQISMWKKQLLDNSTALFESSATAKQDDSEKMKDELFKQIGQLRVENEWLKKKSAQFIGH
jgi:transposase